MHICEKYHSDQFIGSLRFQSITDDHWVPMLQRNNTWQLYGLNGDDMLEFQTNKHLFEAQELLHSHQMDASQGPNADDILMAEAVTHEQMLDKGAGLYQLMPKAREANDPHVIAFREQISDIRKKYTEKHGVEKAEMLSGFIAAQFQSQTERPLP